MNSVPYHLPAHTARSRLATSEGPTFNVVHLYITVMLWGDTRHQVTRFIDQVCSQPASYRLQTPSHPILKLACVAMALRGDTVALRIPSTTDNLDPKVNLLRPQYQTHCQHSRWSVTIGDNVAVMAGTQRRREGIRPLCVRVVDGDEARGT